MRLKCLELKAFGHFKDRMLAFDSTEPGLHIIFGPNEAGKSTSLRGLKALLYGFPERTSDNFQFPNEQLLVSGCLQGADGREITFQRRKKRKADLLDSDGNPMEPGVLAAFLHGIEPALFESLYGIDHRILVEGGEDILAQKGEVGQALFAAGAGISSLKKILDSLDLEADELFKARGAKQKINQAVSEYKDIKKDVREASLPSSKWKEHKKRLKEAEDKQAELEQESRQKSAEMRRLERLHKAIPELAVLENLQKQLLELGDVVVLPQEFPELLQQVEQDIRETKLQINKDKDRLQKLKDKQNGIFLNQPLLDHAESIKDLHQRIGAYRDGQRDRIKLDGMRITHRKDAGALIEEIRPDLKLKDADALRPVLSRKRTIQDLSSRYEALMQQTVRARKQKGETEEDLKETLRSVSLLPAARDGGPLEKSIKLARLVGDIDGQIEGISQEIVAGKKRCQTELKRLGLWSGALEELVELTLPLLETIRRFEMDYSELDKEKRQLADDRKKAEADLKTANLENKEVAYAGEVPTEQDLDDSRKKRQEGWQLLCRQWIDGEDVSAEARGYASGQAVHDVYEKHVEQADHVADRLRREAGRVTKAAALRARIESLEETIQQIRQREQALEKRLEGLGIKWLTVWESLAITPLSPSEMLAWLTDIDTLRYKVTEILGRQGEVQEKDEVRQQYRNALLQQLTVLGEKRDFSEKKLAPVLVFSESVQEEIQRQKAALEKLNDKKTQLQKALEKAEKEEEAAKEARAEWEKKWEKALAGLGLQGQVLPSEALDLLEIAGECFTKIEKANELQSRIDGIDRDMKKFHDDVRNLLEKTTIDLKDFSADQAALQLHSMLVKAQQDSEFLKENREDIEVLTIEVKKGEMTLGSLDEQMAKLLATAKCDRRQDLAEIARKSAQYQRLHEKVSDVNSALAKVSEGVSLEEIKHEATEVNVDELPGQITKLKRQIDEELYPRIKDMLKEIGEENKELQLMDGSAKAAEAAEKLEQVAARIRRLVDQYIRIKLAAMVLRQEIDSYREAHQDPVLQIASRHFVDLTLGSFKGLRTDLDDKGEPILVGIRPDDIWVPVAGMSDGTRDQLYLALRLATLEWRMEISEPMPFIVDDILINFDDDRSRATLKVLAALGRKNQVILFTHHRQIVDEAAKVGEEGEILIHEL